MTLTDVNEEFFKKLRESKTKKTLMPFSGSTAIPAGPQPTRTFSTRDQIAWATDKDIEFSDIRVGSLFRFNGFVFVKVSVHSAMSIDTARFTAVVDSFGVLESVIFGITVTVTPLEADFYRGDDYALSTDRGHLDETE